MELNKNSATLIGRIVRLEFSHEIGDEGFYGGTLRCRRHSGTADDIPFVVSERLLERRKLTVGDEYLVRSRICSRDEEKVGRTRLRVFLLISSIVPMRGKADCNNIDLEGYISTEPVYRETLGGTKVYRFMMATNFKYKSYYIPCVAFGGTAEWMQRFSLGDKITISGRIQSREYVTSDFATEEVVEIAINRVGR